MIKLKTLLLLREEIDNKDNYILYHSTDSPFFNDPDPNKAVKGKRYFNPLGNGMYFTTNKDFSKGFGKNTYVYLLPKNSKIKFITLNKWKIEYAGILSKVLKKLGINYWDGTNINQKVELNKTGNDAPINSLNELSAYLEVEFKIDGGIINNIIEEVSDNRNKNYDAVWFRNTNYVIDTADEIIVPFNKFRKDKFVKMD